MEFISSPFSCAAVDLLEELGVKRYKIGSGEVSNYLMLEKIAKTGKPILLSFGMSSFSELDQTIDFLKEFDVPLSVLQCTTNYPTRPEEWGLNVLQELKSRYDLPLGFSDHSGDIFACLAATSLGAEILEFHVVFDKRMFGPDANASLTIDQISRLSQVVSQINRSLGNVIDKENNAEFSQLKKIFEKSLAVNKDLASGHVINISDLEAKKPSGEGIAAKDFRTVIGKKLTTVKKKWEFLNQSDFE